MATKEIIAYQNPLQAWSWHHLLIAIPVGLALVGGAYWYSRKKQAEQAAAMRAQNIPITASQGLIDLQLAQLRAGAGHYVQARYLSAA